MNKKEVNILKCLTYMQEVIFEREKKIVSYKKENSDKLKQAEWELMVLKKSIKNVEQLIQMSFKKRRMGGLEIEDFVSLIFMAIKYKYYTLICPNNNKRNEKK